MAWPSFIVRARKAGFEITKFSNPTPTVLSKNWYWFFLDVDANLSSFLRVVNLYQKEMKWAKLELDVWISIFPIHSPYTYKNNVYTEKVVKSVRICHTQIVNWPSVRSGWIFDRGRDNGGKPNESNSQQCSTSLVNKWKRWKWFRCIWRPSWCNRIRCAALPRNSAK